METFQGLSERSDNFFGVLDIEPHRPQAEELTDSSPVNGSALARSSGCSMSRKKCSLRDA